MPALWPDLTIYGVIGGFVAAAAVLTWWLFLSRAAWMDRLGALGLMIAGIAATWRLVHVSISTGAMGGLLPLLAVPPLSVAFVVWAVATRSLDLRIRRTTMVATILVACGVWTLVKTGGFDGSFQNDLMWRWAQSKEDRLVADPSAALPPPAPVPMLATPTRPGAPGDTSAQPSVSLATPTPANLTTVDTTKPPVADVAHAHRAEWPGFRGPLRDGVARGLQIDTDWTVAPPAEIWRRPIGPGWASFAVQDDLLFTQEQRGDDEFVAAYDLATGTPRWSHRDPVRFWESNGGAGPRATPSLSNGRVYAMGATGVLNVMDARTGALIWSRNVATDTHVKVPMWGLSSSPLVVGNIVVAAVSGTMAGYDRSTGAPRWTGPHHDLSESGSYSSPHRLTLDGVEQVVLVSEAGATGVTPSDGSVLWEFALTGSSPVLQPVLTPDGDLLIHQMSMSGAMAIRRIAVSRSTGGWTTTERWTSDGLKTMFNDFVIHHDHAYGFDGSIFACINLTDGTRAWKRGRYGNGQVLLLGDQGVLLVLSEEGDVALVDATPGQFKELGRFKALNGKTWSHPVVVGNTLLVRNGEEMAAFRLSLKH